MHTKPFKLSHLGRSHHGRLTFKPRGSTTLVFNIDHRIEIAGVLVGKILRKHKFRKIVIYIKGKSAGQMADLLEYVKCPGYRSIFCQDDEKSEWVKFLVIEKIERGMYYG